MKYILIPLLAILCIGCNKNITYLNSTDISTTKSKKSTIDNVNILAYSPSFLTYSNDLHNMFASIDTITQINEIFIASYRLADNIFWAQISASFPEFNSIDNTTKDMVFEEAEELTYGSTHIKGLRKFLKDIAELMEEKEARLTTNNRMSNEEFADRYNLIADRLNSRNQRIIIHHI